MKAPCIICDDIGWVCENHRKSPWGGASTRWDACECGAGVPCVCNTDPGNDDRAFKGGVIAHERKGPLS